MTSATPHPAQRLAWIVLALAAFTCGLLIAYTAVIRPWHMRYNMSDADLIASYPGDEYVSDPLRLSTRSTVIAAPAGQVWPWVAQVGADEAGFYSYDWLEGLMGCPITNADRIHEEWQAKQPGDQMALCPDTELPPPYEVVSVIPGQALILGHRPTPADNLPGLAWAETWSFIVQPIDANTSRVIIRARSKIDPTWMKAIEPGVFVMEYGMLNGLKERAEQ